MATNAWGTGTKADEHEHELELPAMDGEEEAAAEVDTDELPETPDDPNALDDATGEADVIELTVEGSESGWLVDADDASGLDLGGFDVTVGPEGFALDDMEDATPVGHDDLLLGDEAFVADGGEEGPLGSDEELREEDLPALDADDDGDVPDDALFDRAVLAGDDELRWDDRAWARAETAQAVLEDADDSGVLAVPSDDPTHARDTAWKKLEQAGGVMAAAFIPGGSVVLAVASADRTRALLVRVQPDGEARIIAEIDPSMRAGYDEKDDACMVDMLRWHAASNSLLASGSFGVEAYRPA